jgi:hypothetical protein
MPNPPPQPHSGEPCAEIVTLRKEILSSNLVSDDEPLLLASAFKHGCLEVDILQVYRYPEAHFTDRSGERPLVMYVGWATGPCRLEVGAVTQETYGVTAIVHAMRARPTTMRKAGLLR